jgi:hypothetical protein
VRHGDDPGPARHLARDPVGNALHAVYDERAPRADPEGRYTRCSCLS